MGRHTVVHATRKPPRPRRIWIRVLVVVGIAFVVIAVAAGVMSWRLYQQARSVKEYESRAVSSLSSLSSVVKADGISQSEFSKLEEKISSAQMNTRKAKAITHGRLWDFAAVLPLVGDDIATVQGMTDVVSDVAENVVPRLADVIHTLQNSTLSAGDATINLSPILASQKEMSSISVALNRQTEKYDNLATPRLTPIKTAYLSGQSSLSSVKDSVTSLADGFRILPEFLGAQGARTYAVMAMTTSEARSSGGLIGSVGEMHTNKGAISIGDFRSNKDYLSYKGGTPTSDESRLFTAWGPLKMSFDIRDSAVYPDTARVAEAMKGIWKNTPWGTQKDLDGVILVDPVVLQQLIAATGNVTLPDGRVLTGSNTAEFLLNTVYIDYPVAQQDQLFELVAERTLSSAFSDMTVSKLMTIGTIMGSMAQGRHMSVFVFDSATQKAVAAAGFTASSPDSEKNPSVGVYITQQSPSKMDWYVHRTSTVVRLSCNTDGSQTYQVTYRMKNTLSSDKVADLPSYITGSTRSGNAVEKTLVYPPSGGSIRDLTIDGDATSPKSTTLNGKKVYASVITIPPGGEATISFTAVTSVKSVTNLRMDQTPMGWVDQGITYDMSVCTVEKRS